MIEQGVVMPKNILLLYRKIAGIMLLIGMLASLTASCGGGTDSYSGGGIGGTGRTTGTITGFGSVFVNGNEFDTTGSDISIDDSTASENDLKVGMKVAINAINNTAMTIEYEPEVRGPVSSIDLADNSLTVLGQDIVVHNTTNYDGIVSLADLQVGNYVEISGFLNADGEIIVTFISSISAPQKLQVRSYVSNHNAVNETFSLNNLLVDYSGVQAPPSISNGTFVEVEGLLQGGIFVASELTIESPVNAGNPGDEMELEGLITAFVSQTDFNVNGMSITTYFGTEFEHGNAADLGLNIRVEVKGTINNNGILLADKVEFRFFDDAALQIEGLVEGIDYINSIITISRTNILITGYTQFEDESDENLRTVTFDDIRIGDFLEVVGFTDGSGQIVAYKVEREDDSD